MILKYLIILTFMHFSLKLKSKVFSVEKDINSYTMKYLGVFFFVEIVSIRVHAKEINVIFFKICAFNFLSINIYIIKWKISIYISFTFKISISILTCTLVHKLI
jgi:hypothetical protein